MTNQDFSDQFTVLLNSYANTGAFGEETSKTEVTLDEYEKSVFLSKAQEEIVEDLYAGKILEGESYEETEKMRRRLANLNTEMEYEPLENTTDFYPISGDSQFFEIDSDVMFITYEAVKTDMGGNCLKGQFIEVVPARQDEYHRQRKNPFRGPTKRRALRFDKSDNVVEIVYPLPISTYYVRYVRKPRPIILTNLPDGMTIHGKAYSSKCELDEMLHQRILDRAVQLALQSRVGAKTNTRNGQS